MLPAATTAAVPGVPAHAAVTSAPMLNNLLHKPEEKQSGVGGVKPSVGLVASHALPPQPARPTSMATAAPVKKAKSISETGVLPTTNNTNNNNNNEDHQQKPNVVQVNTLSVPGVPSVTPIQLKALPAPHIQQATAVHQNFNSPVTLLPTSLDVSTHKLFIL